MQWVKVVLHLEALVSRGDNPVNMFQVKRHRPKTGHCIHKVLGFGLQGTHQRSNLNIYMKIIFSLDHSSPAFSGKFMTPELVSQ